MPALEGLIQQCNVVAARRGAKISITEVRLLERWGLGVFGHDHGGVGMGEGG